MTRDQALKEAKRRWGTRALIRAAESRSSSELRSKAKDDYERLKQEKETIEREISDRLDACDWYQELLRRRSEIRQMMKKPDSERFYHRFAVGKTEIGAFWIMGEGDTWEEAFADVEAKAKR